MIVAQRPILIAKQPLQGDWTVADWEQLPEDSYCYEVLNGNLTMTTAPSSFHQWITTRLMRYLGFPAEDQGFGLCFTAPIGVFLGPKIAVQPDFFILLKPNLGILRGGRVRGAPDLVIEILSPGNTAKEMREKQKLYAAAGVTEYAVIEPEKRILRYYQHLKDEVYSEEREFAEGETITFACLPTIPLVIAQLFADAPDPTIYVE